MQEVRRETGLLSDTMGGISHLGRNMTLAITTPILAAAGASVKLAADFDASMRNINSIAFLSEQQLAALTERTLEFGESIRSGPQAASEALYTVFSAGITDVEKAFQVMQIGAKTAEAGLADLTTTTEGLTAAALTFGDQSEAALLRFSDATTLAVQLGVGSMDTFNTGIANVMGTGAAVGATFEDLSATLAFLSQRGVDFASAGTYLNNALTKMLKPGEELAAVFDEIGVRSGKELITTFGGIEGALRAIYQEVGSDENAWAKLFPDARGFKAVSRIFTMFEEDGVDAVSAFWDNFNTKMDEGGITTAAWEQQMQSFAAQWDLMIAAVQGFAITIGQILLPIITPVIQKFTEFIGGLSDAEPELLKIGVAVAAVVAAAGPLLWLLGSLLTPVGLIAGAIAGLAVAFTTNFGGIRDTVSSIVTEILGDLQPLIDGVNTFLNTLFGETEVETGDISTSTDWGSAGVKAAQGFQTAITETMSAWDLFESSGLNEQMSWTEFQNKLVEQGWTGGALTAGMNFTFFEEGNTPMDALDRWLSNNQAAPADAIDRWMAVNGSSGGEAQDNSFMGKLAAAIEAAGPQLTAAFETAWNNLKTWVEETAIPGIDTWGGDAINKVASWFGGIGSTGEGDSPVYEALRSLLSGDIGKAASDLGGWFDEHFPTVSAAIDTFLANITGWLSNEGIPTLARGIGYFGGRLVALLNSAVSGAFQFITGGGTPGATAGDVAAGLQESVLTPLSEGFQEALGDAGINPGTTDSFFTNLEGILIAGLAAWTIAPTFATNFLSKIATSIKTHLATTTLFDTIGTSVSSKVASIFATKGGILDDIALRGMFAVDKIKTALSTAITGAVGLLSAAAPIALPALAIAATLGALTLLVSEDAREEAHRVMRDLFGDEAIDSIEAGFTDWLEDAIARVATAFGREDIAVAAGGDEWHTAGFAAGEQFAGGWSARFSAGGPETEYSAATALGLMSGADYSEAGRAAAKTAADAFYGALNTELSGDGGTLDMSDFRTMEINSTPLVQGLIDDINATTITPEQLTEFSGTWSSGLNGAMAAGEFDGQKIVDELIKPVADGFITNFGTEAPATLTWVEFTSKITTGLLDIQTKMTELPVTISTQVPTIVGAFAALAAKVMPPLNSILGKINSIVSAIASLVNAINSVNGMSVNVNVPTGGGGGGTPGAHASGGTIFGGMSLVGERGPELIDMGANKGTVFPTRMLRDGMLGGGQSGMTIEKVNVYGVTDVHSFLYEMKRLGYDVGMA